MGDQPSAEASATLREQAAKYRKLAEERRAAGDLPIAEKLMDVARELDAKADKIQRQGRSG